MRMRSTTRAPWETIRRLDDAGGRENAQGGPEGFIFQELGPEAG